MNFLKVEGKKAFFIISDREIKPEKMLKDELLEILNMVYENHDSIVFPSEGDLDSIANPIEKEIVQQITFKIKELHTNVPSISKEIKSRFPDLDYKNPARL